MGYVAVNVGSPAVTAVNDAIARYLEEPSALRDLAGGGPIAELEDEIGAYLGVPYALGINSGTASLYVALLAAGVGPGTEVIMSTYDWGAAATATLQTGAVPVLADIDPTTYTLDSSSAASCVSDDTAAIVVTHLYGHMGDMPALRALADEAGVALIEDAAHSLGASRDGFRPGQLGDAACLSLGPGKDLAAGEGGILATTSRGLYERAVQLSQHPLRHRAEGIPEQHLALSLRLHPLAALVALEQIRTLDDRLDERRARAASMDDALGHVRDVERPAVADGAVHTFYRYCPTLGTDDTDGAREALSTVSYEHQLLVGPDPVGIPLDQRLPDARCAPDGLAVAHARTLRARGIAAALDAATPTPDGQPRDASSPRARTHRPVTAGDGDG